MGNLNQLRPRQGVGTKNIGEGTYSSIVTISHIQQLLSQCSHSPKANQKEKIQQGIEGRSKSQEKGENDQKVPLQRQTHEKVGEAKEREKPNRKVVNTWRRLRPGESTTKETGDQ